MQWLEEGAAKLLSRLSLQSNDTSSSAVDEAANLSSRDPSHQADTGTAGPTMELSWKDPLEGQGNVAVLVIGTSKRSARLLRHVAALSGTGSGGESIGGTSDKGSGFYPAAKIHCTQVADENQIGSR